ncbi:hypothetical protein JCM11641_007807 [Rhodosporidiobolus odoratus]
MSSGERNSILISSSLFLATHWLDFIDSHILTEDTSSSTQKYFTILDRLPVELLDHVVRLTQPQPYSSSDYRRRQDTLLALGLVCRATRGSAHAALFGVVEVTSKKGWALFVKAVKAKKASDGSPSQLGNSAAFRACAPGSVTDHELPKKMHDICDAFQDRPELPLTHLYLAAALDPASLKPDDPLLDPLQRLQTGCTASNINISIKPPIHAEFGFHVSADLRMRCIEFKKQEERKKEETEAEQTRSG